MPIDFESTELTELTPRIAVMGVGGAGCNAVTNMIRAELQGVDFIVANTDAQSLTDSGAGNKIQLGAQITQGLGAGAQPKVGQAAAEESLDLIDQTLNGYHMAFITAGMGGGTGTGAAPVIARRAREKGVLTVGVVTKPFQFEGGRRMKIAESGIQELAAEVDTLIIIPNQNLFRVANERTTFAEAFAMADEVLHSGVRGITDLMVMPGLINLDFADVRTVMSEMGKAMMGTGEAEGETRAGEAAAAAISNPLLEEASLKGAKGVIINVTGGMDMTLYEVDEAVNMVREQADPDALIVFGSAFSQDLEGRLRVSVVATGIEGGNLAGLPTAERQSVRGASRPVSAPVTETPAPNPPSAHVAEQPVAEGADAAPVAEPAVSVQAQPVADEESVAPVAETAVTMDAPVESPPATPPETQPEAPSGPLDMTDDQGTEAADPASVSAMDVETRQADTTVAAVDALEEKAVAARAEDLFVADAPMTPKASSAALGETPPGTEPLTRPNAFDEAAYLSGTSESPSPAAPRQAAETTPQASVEEPARPAAKRSFFQLMTAGLRGAQEGEDLPAVRQPAASNDTGARPAPAAAPARDQAGLGAVQADDRPAAPAGRGTEQLEIPSFLKRQQN